MSLPIALDTALRSPSPTIFAAIEIVLPGRTLRLLDGASELFVLGDLYGGEAADFGTLGAIEAITEAFGSDAPRARIQFLPYTNAAAAELADPAAQGSPVTIRFGAVDPATGTTVVADPLFVGELDTSQHAPGETTILSIEVMSAWERFFDAAEGAALTNSFWTSLHPGDRSMEYIPQIQKQLPWGADGPRPSVVADASISMSNQPTGGFNLDLSGGLL